MTNEQKQDYTLRISQANHSGLILILTDILCTYISDSVSCYDEKVGNKTANASFAQNISLAQKSANELISCFSMSNKEAREVVSVLRFVYGRISLSQTKRCPVDLDVCLDILGKLRVAFEKLHEIDTDGPVMKNTHQVYAGLTYGRGTLNESIYTDVSNRGFMA